MEIKGKVAIVTGSAKRVGKSIALALAQRGAHVIIHYKSSEDHAYSTVETIKSYGVESYAFSGDLSSPAEAASLVHKTLRHFPTVDILVNSASIYERTPLARITEKEWDKHLDTNLKGAFFIAQAAARVMLKQKSGKIVNIIDSDVHRPYKEYLPYLVSKTGMVGLTQCLAMELAPHVQVNGVSPGPVLMQPHWGSNIVKAIIKTTPLGRIGQPEDVANTVLFCIEGTDFMTGAIIPIDGGQHIL